jgi:RimJ/RimL family protein N-acetyltransferase
MLLPTPTLDTPRLHLRPVADADAAALFALHGNRHIMRYWDSPPWEHPAQAERFIATCRQYELDGTGARLAITRPQDAGFLGWCALSRWDPVHRSAKLGYLLETAVWGQGLDRKNKHHPSVAQAPVFAP